MTYQWPAKFSWNYDRGEIIADGVIHAMGICLGLIGAAIIIVLVGTHSTRSVVAASVLIYAAALLAMLGFSAAYNMWPVSHTKWILRRFDHSAIYLLIAGTYTPFIAQLKNSFAAGGLLHCVHTIPLRFPVFRRERERACSSHKRQRRNQCQFH